MKISKFGMLGLMVFAGFVHADDWGQESEKRLQFYVGLAGAYQTLSGDFSGEDGIMGYGEATILPSVERAIAPGAVIGFRQRTEKPWDAAVEVSYLMGKHDVAFGPWTGKMSYDSLSVDGKIIINREKDSAIEPFFTLGMFFPTIVVEGGAVDLNTGEEGDARYTGNGYSFGAGFNVPMGEHFIASVGASYRILNITGVKGVSGTKYSISERPHSADIVPTISLSYLFN